MALQLLTLERRCVPAVRIQLDYSLDDSGFFADPLRRQLMDQAAAVATARLNESLPAIVPSGENQFYLQVENPSNGQSLTLASAIPADTLRIYVGGRAHDGSELAEAVMGQQTATGTPAWLQFAQTRGLNGAIPTVWGGSISFDNRPTTPWHFGLDTNGLDANESDFLSVATHEIFHILGVGISKPWHDQTVYGDFLGANSTAVYGGAVPLSRDRAHWDGRILFDNQPTLMDPVADRGQRLQPTALDYAALQDVGWTLTVPTADTLDGPLSERPNFVAVGAGEGELPIVRTYDPTTGSQAREFLLAPASFRGGMRVATGDVDADGWGDLIASYGPGGSPLIQVISGQSGEKLRDLVAFESSFQGGVNLSTADLNGDGHAEIIATPDEGGGPRIRIFDGATGNIISDFLGIDDASFRGGARASLGDLNGDGYADLLVGAGYGGGPRVAVFDGLTLTTNPQKLTGDFFVFEPELRNGVYVAVHDINGDGVNEAVLGGGPGGGPRVLALDGTDLMQGVQTARANFFAGNVDSRSGVQLATNDVNGDGRLELLTATTDPQASARIRAYPSSPTPMFGGEPTLQWSLDPGNTSTSANVFVG